ncbi:hypothetical protein [Luteimonas sp. FCS-9]|uniref:hypothetical protein n=1 Tax=Luteimonas sp. FCS-9 TaxID=1547516 RepID=UPI00063E9F65|nr:hypothetical protein [Luteimonas sp. FCS-9]KLJ01338.1 hypothetical protein WQ56_06110 [Luteimonas sp. FCS-9]
MPARAVWRILVLPSYVLIAGAVFAFALARTQGSIIGGLAALAPWALVLSVGLAALLAVAGVLRWRRRLHAMRRAARQARVRAADGRRTSAGRALWAQMRADASAVANGDEREFPATGAHS